MNYVLNSYIYLMKSLNNSGTFTVETKINYIKQSKFYNSLIIFSR